MPPPGAALQAFASRLDDDDRAELMKSTQKEKTFIAQTKWKRIVEAGNDIQEARLTLRNQRIYMPAEITKRFEDAIEVLSSVEVAKRLAFQNPNIPEREFSDAAFTYLHNNVALFEELANATNARLFRDELTSDRLPPRAL